MVAPDQRELLVVRSPRRIAENVNHSPQGGSIAKARKRSDGNRAEELDEDAVINLSGRLDLNTSPNLRNTALKLYIKGHCKNLTIDFANVSYIDTSGLATLLEILLTAKERCAQLTLCDLSEKVRYLLDVNGLTGFFRIESSERE
jgi:anti-sigma B factor antagonist